MRSARVALFTVALFVALLTAQVASAAVLEFTEDFDDGAVSSPFSSQTGVFCTSGVTMSGPARSGTGSMMHRVEPTAKTETKTGLSISLPTGGTRYEVDGWVYVADAYRPTMTTTFLLMSTTDNHEVGAQISSDSQGSSGYYGVQDLTRYGGTSLYNWRLFSRSYPQGVWRHFQLDFDTVAHKVTMLLDGRIVALNDPVRAQGTGRGVFFGPGGGWSPGNSTTQYLDDVKIRVTMADPIPPVTTAALQGTTGNAGYYRSPVQVTLAATDNGGSVARTEYSLDGGTSWLQYSAPFTVGTQGASTVTYRSTDTDANTEAIKSVDFRIDSIAPAVSASLSGTEGDNGWYRSEVAVAVNALDGGSGVGGVECSFDGGESWETYSEAVVVDRQGESAVLYRAIDVAGNLSENGVASFKIDSIAPVVTVASPSGSYWADASVVVDWAIAESGSGIASIDSFAADASVMLVPFGVSTGTVTARDLAGNTGTASTTWSATTAIKTRIDAKKKAGAAVNVWAYLSNADGPVRKLRPQLEYRLAGTETWLPANGPKHGAFLEKSKGAYKCVWKTPRQPGNYELRIVVGDLTCQRQIKLLGHRQR